MIKLNVGGHIYVTTKDTLTCRDPGSMLAVMMNHQNPAQMIDGAYFIDRDPEIFRWLMLYFRGSNILPKRDSPELWLLKEEAEYFAVDGLATRIQHILCPSFKKNDNIMVRSTKFTILDVQKDGYRATRGGQQFKIDASENVEPTTIQVGDIVMVWRSGSKRRKGLLMSVVNKECTIQFDGDSTCVSCPISGIRF